MTAEDAAYLAGIVDGEGCISTDSRQQVRLAIEMTDLSVMSWISKVLEKPLYSRKRGKCKTIYAVIVVSQKASAVLIQLIPWLRIKQRQALVAIHLCKLKSANQHTGLLKIQNKGDQQYCANLLKKLKKSDFLFSLPLVVEQPRPFRHGTQGGYNRRCRCDSCKKANTDGARKYRALRKSQGRPVKGGRHKV
jgi:hypothetical protein